MSPSKLILPIIALACLIATSAVSYPRLATEHAIACKSCHINPTGGGARTEFGNHSVALNELCLPQTKSYALKRYKRPRLSESVLIGFDTRHLILDDGYVFRMQTDAFLTIEPFEDFYYHLRFFESGIFENFSLLYFDDKRYFVKFGRFYPAFGLKNADHKQFNRERTGHGSNVYWDGLSVGFESHGVNVTGEIFNVNRRGVLGLHVFRTGWFDPVGYMAGASLRLSEEFNGTNGAIPHAKSLFGGLNWNRFTILGELDLVGQSNDTLIVYGNLTTRLEYGLYAIAEYSFFDGDRDYKSGVEDFMRFSVELYPLPFVQLRPSYTYYTRGPLKDENNFFVQIHFGY